MATRGIPGWILIDNLTLSDKGTSAQFVLPTQSVDIFDRTGNIPIWRLARIFECSRVTAIFNPEFFFRKMLFAQKDNMIRTAFIVVINMDIKYSMYKKFHRGKYRPLDLTSALTGFGRTSMDYVTTIVDPSDQELLATLRFKYASVDLATRKSVAIPKEILDEYKVYSKPELAVESYRPGPLPKGAYTYEYTIRASDIDNNNHVNNTVYLRMCMDCAAEAGLDDYLKNFPGDVADYRVKKVNGLYIRECRFGDPLEVYCWETDSDQMTIHFEIRTTDRPSFHCSVEFYGDRVDAKL